MTSKIRVADLFSGCGGLSNGFWRSPEYKHVLASDIWEQAKKTYELNYKSSKFLIADLKNDADKNELVSKLLGKVDLIMGGPPCKGFSTLNNSRKISEFNSLVDRFFDIIDEVSPKIFLMENVRGFKSKKHISGKTYSEHVKDRIDLFDNKYLYLDFVLDTYDFGIGQKRKRYFLVGFSESSFHSSVLDKFEKSLVSKKSEFKLNLRDCIGDLPDVPVRMGSDKMSLPDGSTVYNHKSMNHSTKLEERFKHVPVGGGLMDVPVHLLTNHLKKVVEGGYGSGGFKKNIYGRMKWDEPSGTILAGMDKITVGRFLHPENNRLLTPRECARIQSFSDDFVFTGGMVSQYYQIGNAVPPKLSQVFAESIAEAI